MAVKKATAKKSAAKKKPAKRSVAKKSPARKSAVKKSAVKKTTAKKSAKKKSVAKKSAAKKSTAKKSSARGVKFVVPPVPVGSVSRSSRIDVGTTPTPKSPQAPKVTPPKKDASSNRVVIAVAIGVALLLLIVWGKSSGSDDQAATPAPSMPSVESTSATPEPMESASESTGAVVTTTEAPGGVVAHFYKATGKTTIFWKAPMAVDGLTGYSIEASANGGEWKMLSTVPADQLSLDITKGESASADWTSFRVSSVYSDSQVASAKPFGLAGLYS